MKNNYNIYYKIWLIMKKLIEVLSPYFKLIFPLKKNLDINSKFLTIYELMI